MSVPARIDDELFEVARAVGRVANRSAVQQVQHWARIGMELEASPNVSVAHVERILAGASAYDDAPETAQAATRVAWMELIDADAEKLDLAAEARATGGAWIGADSAGRVVRGDTAGT